VLDFANRVGILPGALLQTLVAQQVRSPTRESWQMAATMLASSGEPTCEFRSALMTAAESMAGARTVIVLRGDADESSRPLLCDMLCQLVAKQVGDVVIDLGHVTFMDTAVARVLAMGHQLPDGQGRRLTFRSPSRLAARVLDRFGLADLIDTREQARR
jgi:anti-anti-sigma factor